MEVPEVFRRVCADNSWALRGNQVEISLPGGRSQTVIVETFVHEDVRLARAYSFIGEAETLGTTRLRSALSINFGLAHGALAITQGHLVVTDTFIVDEVAEGEVRSSLLFLAKSADRYEKLIYGTDEH